MTTLYQYQRVFEDPAVTVGLRFDGDKWEVASRDKRSGLSRSVEVSPGAMEQIIAAWPEIKKAVGR